jgi:hypothetical protein
MGKIEGFETAAQTAKRLGVSDSQVRHLALEGRIAGAVKVVGAWFIPVGVLPSEKTAGGPGRPPRWAKRKKWSGEEQGCAD